ncbi:hypothetical protein DPMN_086252 [Dreissena polymorpha]|uniref:Uncharacterized protein n=1 Tax=Dreissena polymorpha TaxID=45954 RepID=A0A9D4BDI9_DREPO|nr:hypothetical protein DPMN_086252 [Dreissena polymorpha]
MGVGFHQGVSRGFLGAMGVGTEDGLGGGVSIVGTGDGLGGGVGTEDGLGGGVVGGGEGTGDGLSIVGVGTEDGLVVLSKYQSNLIINKEMNLLTILASNPWECLYLRYYHSCHGQKKPRISTLDVVPW